MLLVLYADGDLGNDGEWDNWRLESGPFLRLEVPLFVGSFRGISRVHVWVNVADSPKVESSAGTRCNFAPPAAGWFGWGG